MCMPTQDHQPQARVILVTGIPDVGSSGLSE